MPEPAVEQQLFTQLFEMVGIERDPAWTGRFHTTNALVRTLTHVAAQDGRHSRLLKCDSDGRLLITGDETAVPVPVEVILGGPASFLGVLGSPVQDGGLWYNSTSVAKLLTDMLAILTDVHDPVAHTLKTTVVP